MDKRTKQKRRLGLLAAAGFWLGVWQLAALAVGQPVLLPTPAQALEELVRLLPTPALWQRAAFSTGRILLGFGLGAVCSTVLAAAAWRWGAVELLLAPVMQLVKATPVASFIILALVWVSGRSLSVLISFLMVVPVLYGAVRTGLGSVDRQLVEMGQVFRLSRWRRLRAIWLPGVLPAFRQGCSVALGICWKSGIAAEIIGLPDGSLGDALYRAKITLSTGEMFAWTAVILLLSAGFEKLLLAGLDKRFGERVLFTGLDLTVEAPAVLWAPSGWGKTTLLRILMGLETPTAGTVEGVGRVGAVFQEDRLCPQLTAVENAALVRPGPLARWREEVRADLAELGLDEAALALPAARLSGGQKRRAALVRALWAESDTLLLDEPFTGLDPAALDRAAALLRRRIGPRNALLATHDQRAIQALGWQVLRL